MELILCVIKRKNRSLSYFLLNIQVKYIRLFTGPSKCDKLVFHYFVCEPKDSEPKEIFKLNSQKSPEMLKLPINIISADDVPKVSLINNNHPVVHFMILLLKSLSRLLKLHLST